MEHWTSRPGVAGSVPTVVGLIFQLAWCGVYTQSSSALHTSSDGHEERDVNSELNKGLQISQVHLMY